MKKFFIPALRVATALGLLFIVWAQKNQINDLQTKIEATKSTNDLQAECDSLKSELFAQEIQVSRYEIIMDRLREELSPSCAESVDMIMSQVE